MTQKQISHYRLEALLGEGGMGRVYRATDLVLERSVAIKVILAQAASDATFLERFKREAKLAAQLNHPSIATIYEYGQDGDNAYLAMEYVDGMTLRQLVENGPLSFEMIKKVGEQAADALSFAHQHGIVHRDIKCENLMLAKGGLIKVMDFGIARREGDTQLTSTGQILGTPKTMAPETIKGTESGPPADLFALGVVLFECLTGRSPFQGDDAMALLYQITHEDPPDIRSLRPDTPDYLVDIIHGLLQKDPTNRYGPARNISVSLSQGMWRPELTGGSTETGPTGATVPGAAGMPHDADATLATSGHDAPTMAADASQVQTAVSGTGAQPSASAAGSTPATHNGRWRAGLLAALLSVAVVAAAAIVWFAQQGESPDERRARAVALNDRAKTIEGDSLQVALGLFRQAADIDPGWAIPWINLGALARDAGNMQDAESFFRRALDINPTRGEARIFLGQVLEASGKLPEAEAEYRGALQDEAYAHYAYNSLAFVLLLQEKFEAALAVLDPAIERWPTIDNLWRNRGLCAFALGDVDLARESLSEALTLEPEDQIALDAWLALNAAQGAAQAQQEWSARQLEASNPVDPAVLQVVAAHAALARP